MKFNDACEIRLIRLSGMNQNSIGTTSSDVIALGDGYINLALYKCFSYYYYNKSCKIIIQITDINKVSHFT